MVVMGGDRLVYCGQINDLIALRESHGLMSTVNKVFAFSKDKKDRQLHTANVRFNSPLVNCRWNEAKIKGTEDVSLVAVSRHGERLCEVPAEIELHAGDTVLLEYSPKAKYIERNLQRSLEFFDDEEVLTRTGWPTVVSSLIMLGMILLSSLNIMTLLQSSVLAALLMVIFRCCTPQQAMRSINWNILMIFASSVVLGSAIQNTGLAEMLANVVVGFCDSNPLLLMFAVCLVATFTTEFVSNAAAGAMFYPIVYQAATSMGCDPFPFLIALMISVSSSFATPIGSPTHMLVYGPGGYRFTDFVRIGFWMNLIILAANIFIVNVLWPVI
ncbi:MAG: anion permease [Prevotella sp.]|nr:anion permease [Prevotella sp.]